MFRVWHGWWNRVDKRWSLWQYEGHFQESTANSNDDALLFDHRNADGGLAPHEIRKRRELFKPVSLTFIKNGELYSVFDAVESTVGYQLGALGTFHW
jgi:hypothetical protein